MRSNAIIDGIRLEYSHFTETPSKNPLIGEDKVNEITHLILIAETSWLPISESVIRQVIKQANYWGMNPARKKYKEVSLKMDTVSPRLWYWTLRELAPSGLGLTNGA